MRKAWFWIVLGLVALALAASAVLLVDYVRPAPVFCEEGGGCAAIRQTQLARPFGVPMPVFGVSGFLALALVTFLRGQRARVLHAVLGALGGLFAAYLLYVQLRLGTICPYCAVVDWSAVILMGLLLARVRFGWDPPEMGAGRRGVLVGAAALPFVALAVPVTLGLLKKPIPQGVPAAVAAEMARTPRGQITIIDFIDFECPFCRVTHENLAPIVAQHHDKIRMVRRHVPLRMHPHASDAARAGICAEVLGKGEPMADALVASPPEELTTDATVELAEKIGLDPSRFRACLIDPATDARIRVDGDIFRASNGRGLPLIYVEGKRLAGQQDASDLRAAIDEALSNL